MKTAQNVPRTGLARAKGKHLEAANDQPKPAEMKHLLHRGWEYIPASETDVTRTWRKAGWLPTVRRVG